MNQLQNELLKEARNKITELERQVKYWTNKASRKQEQLDAANLLVKSQTKKLLENDNTYPKL